MAIAGHYELRRQRRQVMTPNYTAIYDFLTQLLEGTFSDVTQLKPIGNTRCALPNGNKMSSLTSVLRC